MFDNLGYIYVGNSVEYGLAMLVLVDFDIEDGCFGPDTIDFDSARTRIKGIPSIFD